MKNSIASILALVCIGCNSPTAPTNQPTEPIAASPIVAPAPPTPPTVVPPVLHHNIPATAPDGTIWWLCSTQLREYSDGSRTWRERDHYLQRAEPIE